MTGGKCCTVLIVERHPLLRELLAKILPKGRFRVVGSVYSVAELTPDLLAQGSPLLLLLGATGHPEATAAEVRAIRDLEAGAKTVVLSSDHNVDEIIMALQAGADGCVSQVAGADALIKALELVIAGETVLVSPKLPSVLIRPQQPAEAGQHDDTREPDGGAARSNGGEACISLLSGRERLTLSILADGNSNKLIARKLGVAEATVKVHVRSILRKIGVQNRTQAALWASQNGLPSVSALIVDPVDKVPFPELNGNERPWPTCASAASR